MVDGHDLLRDDGLQCRHVKGELGQLEGAGHGAGGGLGLGRGGALHGRGEEGLEHHRGREAGQVSITTSRQLM